MLMAASTSESILCVSKSGKVIEQKTSTRVDIIIRKKTSQIVCDLDLEVIVRNPEADIVLVLI